MEKLKRISNSDLYQVGIVGILENRVDKTKMSETNKTFTKNVIRVTSGVLVGVAVWSCYDGQPTVSANPNSGNNSDTTENNPQQSNEIQKVTSAELIMIKDENERNTIISSLPENKPENRDENFDIFSVKVGDQHVNFVMYALTDEEISNGVTIKSVQNGKETLSVQNIALFTEVIEYGGTKRWERLIATNPNLNGDNTVWLYDPNGFPTEASQTIDTSRAVFGYNNDGTNILIQPIIIDPNQIPGYDYTQALPVKLFETPSLMKNASPVSVEILAESQLPP